MESAQQLQLTLKVARIQGYNLKVKKDLENPFLKSKYAGLGSIKRVLDPELVKENLSIRFYHAGLTTTLKVTCLDTGAYDTSSIDMPMKDAQQVGATITYYRRYLLMSYFNLLPSDDLDDDGNSTVKWLNKDSPDWEKVKKAISEGKLKSIADIRKFYGVNKTVEASVLELFNQQKK